VWEAARTGVLARYLGGGQRFAGGRGPEIGQITGTARWHHALGAANNR
jgi:hypothetical protein